MDTDHSPHKIFESLRDCGISRRDSQWMGGVAAGIAERFKVDTVLVRGIAVALALLGGAGMIAYGLAWAFLPDEQGQIHFEQALKKDWTLGMTGALTTFILGIGPAPWVFGSIAPFIWPLLVIAAVLFIVFSRNNTKFATGPKGTPRTAPPADFTAEAAQNPSAVPPYRVPIDPPAPATGFAGGATRWDKYPHTADGGPHEPKEQAMDPDPSAGYTPPEPRTKVAKIPLAPPVPGWVASIVVGVTALIVAAVFCLDYFNVIRFPGESWSLALSLGLLFVGLSLVVAALMHRTSGGLLGLAIPLLVLSVIFGNAAENNTSGFGTQSGEHITQNSEGNYNAVFSNATIDLRHYSNLSSSTEIEINTVFSSVDLLLPSNVPVRIESKGLFLSQGGDLPPGDTSGAAPVLTIEVNGAFTRVDTVPSGQGLPSTTSDF